MVRTCGRIDWLKVAGMRSYLTVGEQAWYSDSGSVEHQGECVSASHQRGLSFRTGRRLSDERENIGGDGVGLGRRHAVWEALVRLERAVLEQLGRERRRIGIGHDLVVIAVHHEDGHA